MIERNTGFGNEPLTTPYENGGVMYTPDLLDYDQDGPDVDIDTDADIDALFSIPDSTQSEAIPSVAKPGVSVRLEERAFAVNELMDGINAQNRLAGAEKSGALNRYRNADTVHDGMSRKAAYYKQSENRFVEMLAKTAELRAAGFTPSEAQTSEIAVRGLLSRTRGVGKEAVRVRNRQKTVTSRTVKKVLGR